jgi:hypothetical protein
VSYCFLHPLEFVRSDIHIAAYLLKARTVEQQKQPLLGNGCVTRNNGITVGSGVYCAVRAEAMQRGTATITGES